MIEETDTLPETNNKVVRLKKDVIIPAGTILVTAPIKVERPENHCAVEAVVGLSRDTAGSFTYYIGTPDDKEREGLEEWFEIISE